MSKSKIAPRLQHLSTEDWTLWLTFDGEGEQEVWEGATRELRALLAVARAAKGLTKPPAPCPPICPEWDAMFRALAHLDRVSRKAKP